MNISPINQYNAPNFGSRCAAVREAQDVVHIIKSQLPASSPSWLMPIFHKFENRQLNFVNIAIHRRSYINKINDYIIKFGEIRPKFGEYKYFEADYLIKNYKNHKVANCGEYSYLSNIMLQMNGRKNVYIGDLVQGNCDIDHVVCFYNADDTLLDKISNKTIIIDTWSGIAGFAKDVLKDIETSLIKHDIRLPLFGKLTVKQSNDQVILCETSLNLLKNNYPELILYKNKGKFSN